MILQIFSNPNWVYIINFVGITLGIISLYKSYKYPFEKDFDLINWENSLLTPKNTEELSKEIKTHKIELLFKNLGLRTTLLRSDLARKISIELGSRVKIERLEAYTNDKYNTISSVTKDNKVEFYYDYIEPKKYLKIILHYLSAERVSAQVEGKIIGGNEITGNINNKDNHYGNYRYEKKISDAKYYHFPLITVMFFLILRALFLGMFNIESSNVIPLIKQFNKESLGLIFILIIISVVSVLLGYNLRKAFIPMSKLAEKEKNWYRKI